MQPESSNLLTLENIHTHIDHYHILHGVTFNVPKNQTTLLLGRNGAGKTTTLRSIMGLWPKTQGGLFFRGESILGTPTHLIAQKGIAYVPEDMGIFAMLTVKENMLLATHRGKLDTDRLEWIFGFFPALKQFWLSEAGNLSGGQKQMLAIARAIIEPRELLLVDEPSKGLAPAIINNVRDAFIELREQNTTILLVEQNFQFASALGDQVVVMDNGVVVHEGSMQELADDKPLQARLLGLSLQAA